MDNVILYRDFQICDLKELDEFSLVKELRKIETNNTNILSFDGIDVKNINDSMKDTKISNLCGLINRFFFGEVTTKSKMKIAYFDPKGRFSKKQLTFLLFLSNFDTINQYIQSELSDGFSTFNLDTLFNILSNDRCHIVLSDLESITFNKNMKDDNLMNFLYYLFKKNRIDGIELKNSYPGNIKNDIRECSDFNPRIRIYERFVESNDAAIKRVN